MRKKIRLAGFSFLVVVGIALLWLDRQFEEPNAQHVESLTRHLGAKNVLGVLAHPDDEILIAGLLADSASRPGTRVNTLTLTAGEAGVSKGYGLKPERLSQIRIAELRQFGKILGLDEQEILKYPDGRLTEQSSSALETDIVLRIRRWQPDLVVTFDPATGLTLHSDHMAVGAAATNAILLAGNSEYAPELGETHTPKWLAYVVSPRRMLVRFGGEGGRKIADAQAITEYAVSAKWRLKVRGWEVHESQRHVIREIFGVPPWLLYSVWDKEHYSLQRQSGPSGQAASSTRSPL